MSIRKIIKEEYSRLILEDIVLSHLNKSLNESLCKNCDDELDEAVSGKKFYDSLTAKGYKKDEVFDVTIPIQLLKNQEKKKARQVDLITTVPIDTSVLDNFISQFKEAKEKNSELYQKYLKWANWYNDFNRLIYSTMSESDANLFLAAAAFCSANTALDINIIEAAKLYKAVKTDWYGSNSTRKALAFVANNINSIDQQEGIDMLKRLATANCSYASLLVPKRDVTSPDTKQVREITVSRAKLTNYNNFVKYFIKNGGKLSKKKITRDLQSGELDVGGTKVYSFFLNLIDPDYEWIPIDGDENAKIQPATIDRWMITLFFGNPLRELVDELQEEDIINDTPDAQKTFIQRAIMNLFISDKVRRNIVKILNEKIKEHGLDMKAQQLQAFGWVKVREEAGIPSADFASFEDAVNFTQKISDRINDINPELNFINNYGKNIKNEFSHVLSTIELLSKLPRVSLRKQDEIDRVLSNWREFEPEYTLDKRDKQKDTLSIKKGNTQEKQRFILNPLPYEAKPGKWITGITMNGESLATFKGISRNDVIKKAMTWINKHKKFDSTTKSTPTGATKKTKK